MFQRSITKVVLGLVLIIGWSGIVEAGKGGGRKNDSVMSRHIKEADGISGQDTNTGSGIKTGPIQDEAITAAKISFFTNVIVVAPSGGDFTDPITALSTITDASATNPCLVKIMPGVYDIGTDSLQMKEYVVIEGSGENVTKIKGNSDVFFSGVIQGADNTEIRCISVENTAGVAIVNDDASPKISNVTAIASGGHSAVGVFNIFSSTTMTNVTATASGGSSGNYGIYNDRSSTTMTNVTATGSGGLYGYGVRNDSSSPTMTNVTATGSGGLYNSYGVINVEPSGPSIVRIDHSVITGTTNSIYTYQGSTTYVGNTRLDGSVYPTTGTYKCVGAYDADYSALNSSCQ